MREKLNLIQAYQKTLTSKGIIAQLWDYLNDAELLVNAPYLFDEDTAMTLDNYYYFSWSGDKLIAPVLEKMWDADNEELTNQEDIMKMFWDVHSKQLLRLWADATAEYDPVNNYHIYETTDYTHEGDSGFEDSGAETYEKDGTVTESGTMITTSGVWGYNNQTATADNDSTTKVVKGDSGNDLPKTTYDTTDTRRFGKKRSADESATDDLDVEKWGNLGVQSIGQMLSNDIELWKWNFYKNGLFKLLDSFLTIPIY